MPNRNSSTKSKPGSIASFKASRGGKKVKATKQKAEPMEKPVIIQIPAKLKQRLEGVIKIREGHLKEALRYQTAAEDNSRALNNLVIGFLSSQPEAPDSFENVDLTLDDDVKYIILTPKPPKPSGDEEAQPTPPVVEAEVSNVEAPEAENTEHAEESNEGKDEGAVN